MSSQSFASCASCRDAHIGFANPRRAQVWQPMEYEAKATWSWVDWMRFLFYK